MKKFFVKGISTAMFTVLLFTCFFGAVNAGDEIYYTDLFFGYSPTYLLDASLVNYESDNVRVMSNVFNTYLDSDDAILMKIKTGMNVAASDLVSQVKFFCDAFGDTNYSYYDALDCANEAFVDKMFSDGINDASSAFSAKKILSTAKSGVSIWKTWYTQLNDEIISSDDFDALIDLLKEEGSLDDFRFLGESKINTVLNYNTISELSSALGDAYTIADISCAFIVALSMEDFRMGMIDTIIDNSTSGTPIYDGMQRLKSQLSSGWKSYFMANYGTEFLIDELKDVVHSWVFSEIGVDGFSTALGMVKTVLKVTSFVIFDVIMDVPDVNNLITQQTLTHYVSNIYQIMNKIAIRNTDCGNIIFDYENMFTCLVAAVNAGLDSCDNMLVSSNKNVINNIKSQYQNFNYDSYISSVKETILDIPVLERSLKNNFTYELSMNTTFDLATNEPQLDTVYCFNNEFLGNVNFTDGGSIQIVPDTLTVKGNVNSSYDLTVDSKGFAVLGDLTLNSLTVKNSLSVDGKGVNVLGNSNVNYLTLNNCNISCKSGEFVNAYLTDSSLNVSDDLLVKEKFVFSNSKSYVLGNCTLGAKTYGYLKMQSVNDYLFVGNDLKLNYYYNEDHSDSNLTTGTVEVQGDFFETGTTDTYCHFYYYPRGTHKTIFSGTGEQIIHFDNPDYNGFNLVEFKNENVYFETNVSNVTLCNDANIKNLLATSLTVNGYDLTTTDEIKATTINLTDGNVSCKSAEFTNAYLTDSSLNVSDDLLVKEKFVFSNSKSYVLGNCTLGAKTYGYLKMQSVNDYLFVGKDLKLNYSYNKDNSDSNLTTGTVEVQGDFFETGTTGTYCHFYYYPQGTHKTIFSGTGEQIIHFDNPDVNGFNLVEFKNENVYFETNTKNVTLCNDANIKNLLTTTLTVNGYDLTTTDEIKATTLSLTDGNISCKNAEFGDANLTDSELNVIGDLLVNECFVFSNSKSYVLGNCTLGENTTGYLKMQNANDYLFVGNDLKLNYSLNKDHRDSNLTTGTVEVQGDFFETGTTGTYCHFYYYPQGTHKTIFSGTGEQIIHFDNPDVNGFNLVEFKNKNVYFETNVSNVTLCSDANIKNLLATTLTVNGYDLTTENEIITGTLNLTSGNISCQSAEFGYTFITDSELKVANDLSVTGKFSFTNGKVYVSGNCTVGNISNCYIIMKYENDYLFVGGDFTINSGCSSGSSNEITAGTIEVQGDFLEKGTTDANHRYYYNPQGTHKTIFSGTGEQIIHFDNPDINGFNLVEFKNKNVYFETNVSNVTLCSDANIKNLLATTLTVNGYDLITENEIITGTLNLTNGNISTENEIIVNTLNLTDGNVSCKNAEFGNAYLTDSSLNVLDDLLVKEKFVFSNSEATVSGNCTLGNNTTGYLQMKNENDYLFVGKDFTLNYYNNNGGTDKLTAGTVEIQGDFINGCSTVSGCTNYYKPTGSHRTVFSGSDNQVIDFGTVGIKLNKVSCFKNSSIIDYCEENNIDYEIINIGRKSNSMVDYDNKVIFTNARVSTEASQFVCVSESSTLSPIFSGSNNTVFGTGSKLSLCDDGIQNGEYTVIVNGDLDGDSVCDVLDILFAEKVISGINTPTTEQTYAANGCITDEFDKQTYQKMVNLAVSEMEYKFTH